MPKCACPGRPEHDVSDIVPFPVTRGTKRKMGHTTGFVATIETQQNKNPLRIPNFVKQDFLKTEGPQGVR